MKKQLRYKPEAWTVAHQQLCMPRVCNHCRIPTAMPFINSNDRIEMAEEIKVVMLLLGRVLVQKSSN